MQVDYDNSTNVPRIAVETIQNDDILVIDAGGDVSAASFGHIIATSINHRGAAGLVTGGGVRDTPRLRELDLPSYIKASHATTSLIIHHPTDVNVPVGCGGVLVMPGDVIVRDAEGVAVIPSNLAEEAAHGAHEQELIEESVMAKMREGASIKGVYSPDEKRRAAFAASRAVSKAHQGD